MKLRTQAIIGATLVVLGIGVVALGLFEKEQAVRQVWDVVGEPEAHRDGEFVLIGIPQPPQLRVLDADQPNPDYRNETRNVIVWSSGETTYHTTHILRVDQDDAGSTWTFTNRTQLPGRPETATQTHATWSIAGPHTVFLIQGFPDEGGTVPWMWGVYHGVLKDPVQPKPSQFRGHVADHVGDAMLPDGALVYRITEFTAGCSSKFLPPEHQ